MKIDEITSQAETTSIRRTGPKAKTIRKESGHPIAGGTEPAGRSGGSFGPVREMKKIYTAQQMAPDIRTEKVEEVKKFL
jgi:hypothetical protein